MVPLNPLLPRSSDARARSLEMLDGMAPTRLLPLRSSVLRLPLRPRSRSRSIVAAPPLLPATPRHEQVGVARDQVDNAAVSPRLDFHARRASRCDCEVAAALHTAGTMATSMNRTVRTTVRCWLASSC